MKQKTPIKIISVIVSAVMLLSMVPMTVFASIANWEKENVVFDGTSFGTNGYYSVISKKDYSLVPGAAVESEMVINNSTGNRRQVMHIIEVDPSNPDVSIVPGYINIDKDLSDVNNHAVAGVTEMVKKYETELGYNVVGAMNTCLAYDSNAPCSFLVYNGQVLVDKPHGINNFHTGNAQTFLGVYKNEDGTCYCELRTYAQGLRGDEWQAIAANFAMTVNNGVLVSKTEERTSAAAARSMIGIKEDGTLVLVMNDGRGANNSVGFNNYELGESMLALGCKYAFNCDGGGSSSFVTKRAGETEAAMRCVPCDGAERPTIGAVMVVSNVGPTGELNNVNITSDYDYFAPGTSYTFGADAIDTHGYAMDMPADAAWQLSDASFGTIENGVFASNGTTGDVDVQIVSGGAVVGSKTLHIANPSTLSLSATSTTLPYSTADKPRKLTLPVVAKVGEADVFCDGSVFEITSSAAGAGTLDGMTFTATTDESVSGTVLTVKYLPTGQELSFTVSFGKGSELLWDFEDGDISNWYGGGDDVKVWLTENGVAEADQLKTLISGGQISFSEQSHTFLSTRENGGQVHNGNNALGVNFDFRNVEFNSWVYALLYNVQDQYVLRDVANGKKATALGMWCYVPEGFCNPAGDTSGALSMQLTVYKNPQGTSGTQLNFQFYSEKQKKRVSLNQCTDDDIPENRWVYLTADLTGSDYYSLPNPKGTTYREPSFFRMYIKPTRAQVLTYYFDDFTLDYSSAVDDRDAPVITNPTYCVTDTNLELNGNPAIDTNTVSFDASVKDYAASNAEGLDYSTAAIYADGVKLSGVTAAGGSMGVKNVALSNGTHAIKFEIYDKAGNFASVTKNITVDADASKAVVTLSGHNDNGNVPEYDSVYYADLVASDISQIDSVTATLKLNTANTWELDHMTAAPGYEASYTYNDISKLATVTVTKNGTCDLTGEQTLVSIPARVWSFDENTNVGGDGSASKHMTEAERFSSSYGEPKVFVDISVVSGAIAYTDKTDGTFGGSISVATKLTGNKSNGMWHQHTAAALEDKKASCSEEGYSGRTYCEECGSVVDWGTAVPATGHSYELTDGKFVCTVCGDVFKPGTGLFTMNGSIYYAVGDNLVDKWQQIGDDWYYFNTDNYAAKTGAMRYGSVTYQFAEDGKLTSGVWFNDGTGYVYYYGPDYYRCTAANPTANARWIEVDGKTYAVDRRGHRHTGVCVLIESNNPAAIYEFDDDGVLIGKYETDYTGVFHCNNGKIAYLENGVPTKHGLLEYEGDYYYINSTCLNVTGSYNCTNHMTELVPPGVYEFDETGKMLNPPVQPTTEETTAVETTPEETTPEETTPAEQKNGIIRENGELYYYVNDVRTQVGLIQIDGDYYYVRSGGKVATGSYYCTYKMTDQIPAGTYQFDENGKMLNAPVEPATEATIPEETVPEETTPAEKKNGIIRENGELYYYVNDVRTQVGLIQIDGDYYYVRSGGKVATGSYYCTYKMTDQIPAGTYQFDENGKMLNAPVEPATEATTPEETVPEETTPAEKKNGIIRENGELYYYVNDVRTQVGLIQIDGDYYYVRSGGKVATGSYYCTNKMTDQIPAGTYQFDENGKMLNAPVEPATEATTPEETVPEETTPAEKKNGFYRENGSIYYYVDDVRTQAGLMQVGNDYYYVRSGGLVATGSYYCTYKMTDLIPAGLYEFDSDGKMINPPQPVYKDGFVEENGGIFYYKDNVLQKDLGVIVVDGAYYYVRSNGQLATGTYSVDYNTHDYIRGGKHTFDETGKMDIDPYYLVGIRGGRDIAFLNQTSSDVKIKSGMIYRGSELDGAYYSPENAVITEEDKQNGVALLTEKGVKMDMDLRAQSSACEDVLGEDVTHKYYDMVYYDNIFTDEGKAKVKEVFTDLANPDNYPIYCHCTYGLDRTGTVCYLVEALLGFSDWNLSHDYCSTIRSHEQSILKIKDGLIENYEGSTRKEQVTNYLLSCGITQEQLNTICELLLDK